jgi:outer membrane protein assembly factor BamA
MSKHINFILTALFIIGLAMPTIAQKAFENNGLFVIKDFVITGNKKTKSYVIEREFVFKRGDSISFQAVVQKCEQSKGYLLSTRLFVIADVTPVIISATEIVINIDVKERLYIFPLPYFKIASRNFNVWLKEDKASLQRVNYGAKLKWYNFSGRRDQIDFEAYTGFNQVLTAKYRQPYADGSLTWGYSFGVALARTKQVFAFNKKNQAIAYPDKKGDVFNKNFFSISGDITYRKGIFSNHQLAFRYADERISDSLYAQNNYYYGLGVKRIKPVDISYRYNYTDIDYAPLPLKGISFGASLTHRLNAGYSNITQLSTSIFTGTPLGRKFYFLNTTIASIKSKQNLSYINQGFMGFGSFFLRGLDVYVIDGHNGFAIKNTLTKEILNTRIKLPLISRWVKSHEKVPLRLLISGFSDHGYVSSKNLGSSRLNNKWLYTEGVALDILTAYDFQIKLEYSINQLGQKGFFFQTGLSF